MVRDAARVLVLARRSPVRQHLHTLRVRARLVRARALLLYITIAVCARVPARFGDDDDDDYDEV